jgi:hypothetical protein
VEIGRDGEVWGVGGGSKTTKSQTKVGRHDDPGGVHGRSEVQGVMDGSRAVLGVVDGRSDVHAAVDGSREVLGVVDGRSEVQGAVQVEIFKKSLP